MYLGMLPEDHYMVVEQSYHMVTGVENWAQADTLVFDISLYAEQLNGVVEMENKIDSNGENPTLVYGDGFRGTFTYEHVKDATFDWSFTGRVPLPSTEYAVLFYYEPWSSPTRSLGWPRDVFVLGIGESENNGDIEFAVGDNSEDFDQDILNMKVWLAPASVLQKPRNFRCQRYDRLEWRQLSVRTWVDGLLRHRYSVRVDLTNVSIS